MDGLLEHTADGVRLITLNRPATLNALTLDDMRALGACLEEARERHDVRAIVVTGAGGAFSAGGDATFLARLPSMPEAEVREVVYSAFQRPIRAMRTLPKPVIAAIDGPAVGAGCELALAADVRIVSQRARLGEVWIKIGCVPALGGMFLLPRIVGLGRATQMILTGEIVDAAEAHRIGLATRVVPAEALLDTALEMARALAAGPAHALATAKAAIARGLSSDLLRELDATVADQLGCFRTADFAEGVTALGQRRAPQFTRSSTAGGVTRSSAAGGVE